MEGIAELISLRFRCESGRTKKINEDRGLNDIGLGPEASREARATKLSEWRGVEYFVLRL
jgi:hypothetical protein